MKSKIQILAEMIVGIEKADLSKSYVRLPQALKAMEAYAAQQQPKWVPVSEGNPQRDPGFGFGGYPQQKTPRGLSQAPGHMKQGLGSP